MANLTRLRAMWPAVAQQLKSSGIEATSSRDAVWRDVPAGTASPVYRIEHQSAGAVAVLGRSSAADARQAELSQHAGRLIAAGAMGELVLVDEATGVEAARRRLWPDVEPAGAQSEGVPA